MSNHQKLQTKVVSIVADTLLTPGHCGLLGIVFSVIGIGVALDGSGPYGGGQMGGGIALAIVGAGLLISSAILRSNEGP